MDAQDPRDFIHDIAVNFHGPYYLMRLLIPKFRAQRSGCVLNIASRAGTVAIPYSTSYCASKAALINLTACTQKEMDVESLNDIHLYSLHPGGIKSAMTLKSKQPTYLCCSAQAQAKQASLTWEHRIRTRFSPEPPGASAGLVHAHPGHI